MAAPTATTLLQIGTVRRTLSPYFSSRFRQIAQVVTLQSTSNSENEAIAEREARYTTMGLVP